MKTQLISFLVAMVAVSIIMVIAWVKPFGPSAKQKELQARLEVAEQMVIDKAKLAARWQQKASAKDATIKALKEQLKTNTTRTNENISHIATLPPDSLAGLVADQLNFLDTAW